MSEIKQLYKGKFPFSKKSAYVIALTKQISVTIRFENKEIIIVGVEEI